MSSHERRHPSPLQYGVTEVREQFRNLLRGVHLRGERVVITHYNEPVAALIPVRDLDRIEFGARGNEGLPSRRLRENLRDIIDDLVIHHRRTVILNHGLPVAALVPYGDLPILDRQSSDTPTGMPAPGVRMRETTIITFFSHAGGVGKTSSCRDIGYELGQLGHTVLLIDFDPQANLTTFLGVDPEDEGTVTLFGALIDDAPLPPVHRVHGVDLIPADLELSKLDLLLQGMPLGGVDRLKKVLRPVVEAGTYDFILIDTPPTLGKFVLLALFAAHEVIIPVSSRFKGLGAISTVHKLVNDYREYNPRLNILSHLITQRSHTTHSRESEQAVTEALYNVSGPIVTRPAIYDGCQPEGQPVGVYAPNSDARKEIQAAVSQILGFLAVPA